MSRVSCDIPTLNLLRNDGESYPGAFIIGGSELEDEAQDVEG